MKKLFVLGDSISIQYGPFLEKMVADTFAYDRKRSNGGDSAAILTYLKLRLKDRDFCPDILLLNCGLHDLRIDQATKQKQVDLKSYENNLNQIGQHLSKTSIVVFWVSTTPVIDTLHNRPFGYLRYNEDVIAYNHVANTVAASFDWHIIDLYHFSLKLGKAAYSDHVHFADQIRALQAAHIAGYMFALQDALR